MNNKHVYPSLEEIAELNQTEAPLLHQFSNEEDSLRRAVRKIAAIMAEPEPEPVVRPKGKTWLLAEQIGRAHV